MTHAAYEIGASFLPPKHGFRVMEPVKLWWVFLTQVPADIRRAKCPRSEYRGQVLIRLRRPRLGDEMEVRPLNDGELASARELLAPRFERRGLKILGASGVSWSNRAEFVDVLITFS